MTIQVGDRIQEATLYEYIHEEREGCTIGPNPVEIPAALSGKKIVIFAVPGAFTPTCSQEHLPGFIKHASEIKAKGVDEIWCVSVNDAFVMAAWGKSVGHSGEVRLMGDGSALWSKMLGLTLDLTSRGLGIRSQRYAMVVEDAVVKALYVEGPGEFKISRAESILAQL